MSAHGAPIDIEGLPGADLVTAGIADLERGEDTPSAALVRMASPRLLSIGIPVPTSASQQPGSHRLYELLSRDDPAGAYGRYNALLGRMASFADAAEQRASER